MSYSQDFEKGGFFWEKMDLFGGKSRVKVLVKSILYIFKYYFVEKAAYATVIRVLGMTRGMTL